MLSNRIIVPLFLGVGCLLLANEREFRVKKPDAPTAELMAEFNQWKDLSMTKQPNGMWTIKVRSRLELIVANF